MCDLTSKWQTNHKADLGPRDSRPSCLSRDKVPLACDGYLTLLGCFLESMKTPSQVQLGPKGRARLSIINSAIRIGRIQKRRSTGSARNTRQETRNQKPEENGFAGAQDGEKAESGSKNAVAEILARVRASGGNDLARRRRAIRPRQPNRSADCRFPDGVMG
jgi:hypothetical protein